MIDIVENNLDKVANYVWVSDGFVTSCVIDVMQKMGDALPLKYQISNLR